MIGGKEGGYYRMGIVVTLVLLVVIETGVRSFAVRKRD
jgi:hypothetical protein